MIPLRMCQIGKYMPDSSSSVRLHTVSLKAWARAQLLEGCDVQKPTSWVKEEEKDGDGL